MTLIPPMLNLMHYCAENCGQISFKIAGCGSVIWHSLRQVRASTRDHDLHIIAFCLVARIHFCAKLRTLPHLDFPCCCRGIRY